jgi:hypothetical protein
MVGFDLPHAIDLTGGLLDPALATLTVDLPNPDRRLLRCHVLLQSDLCPQLRTLSRGKVKALRNTQTLPSWEGLESSHGPG